MANREPLREEALLFGANTMYEVLEAIVAKHGAPFHGAQLAADTGRTRTQVQRELSKLRKLSIVEMRSQSGRAEMLEVVDDRLGEVVLALPGLLKARVSRSAD